MINRVVLIGRLTRDIELRYTQGGTAVGSFTIAVNRQFTNQQGEREADFINAVIWRKAAENLANFTHKGSLIGIEGRLQTRNYENQQGNRVYVTEVVVENFSLLESRNDTNRSSDNNNDFSNNGNYNNANTSSNNGNSYGGNNFGGNTQNQSTDPFAANSQEIDISDDDLPF
ncbi:single-stranded DNA-binding protein [Periweissella beninensis]|uniref:Single-stranded DNA-binding protein n=1 Tax=Periweissella beninensis TaxID=504936 RepID=A0ABT0VLB1_9LACO|nr:single-stranded DNA-binding protein [Periweissella beninensis]MBM7544967.1 single-strand DNA-binding protein [Periweissella beninensis]MCM2437212.1 single-stranded DNA-binding protein [Periweissella beninensis]MCT4397020.1 single-stranded DNA-binding protein [Periweissella beninensis]